MAKTKKKYEDEEPYDPILAEITRGASSKNLRSPSSSKPIETEEEKLRKIPVSKHTAPIESKLALKEPAKIEVEKPKVELSKPIKTVVKEEPKLKEKPLPEPQVIRRKRRTKRRKRVNKTVPVGEISKRLVMTNDLGKEVDSFVDALRRHSGTRVSLNLLLRALLMNAIQAEESFLDELEGAEVPQQPATHDTLRYAEFEEFWIHLTGRALGNNVT